MFDLFKLPVDISEPLQVLAKEYGLGNKHMGELDSFALDNDLYLGETKAMVLEDIVTSVRAEYSINVRHKHPCLEDRLDEIMELEDEDVTSVNVLTVQDQRFMRILLGTLEEHAILPISTGHDNPLEVHIFLIRVGVVDYYINTMMENYFEEERDPLGLRDLEGDDDHYTYALLMKHFVEDECQRN